MLILYIFLAVIYAICGVFTVVVADETQYNYFPAHHKVWVYLFWPWYLFKYYRGG